LSVYRDHGIVPKNSRSDNFNKTPDDISRYQEVRAGDLVVNKMKAWQGSAGVSSFHGIVSPDYLVCSVAPAVDSRFLHHLLRSAPMAAEFGARSKGIRPAQWRLYWEDLAEVPVTLPPLEQQRRIADFLDAETAQIDRLAELRESQLDMLEARMQSELSERGRALVSSFGAIRVRHIVQKIEQGWSPQCEDRLTEDGEWGVVKAGCVNGGIFNATQHKTLPQNVTPELRYKLHPGDLLMSRASGSVDLIGSIAVMPDDLPSNLLLCDKIYRLRLDHTRMIPHYVAYLLRTRQAREQIKLGISGAEGMANNLPTATITNLLLPEVPLSQQHKIVDDLDLIWMLNQRAIQALNRQLEILAERRQALITAAVTGQIDVTTARGGVT
jgi:type I restriction enzyme S subunit